MKNVFPFHVDQELALVLFQAISLKIYITSLTLRCIHFVNLLCTQFAQFNETTKCQAILRLYLGDIAETQFILKSGLGKFPFLIKCVLTTLIIYQRSSIMSYTFLKHVMQLHVFTNLAVKKKQAMC